MHDKYDIALMVCGRVGLSDSRIAEALVERESRVRYLEGLDKKIYSFVEVANSKECSDDYIREKAKEFVDSQCEGEDYEVVVTDFQRPILHDAWMSSVILRGPEVRLNSIQTMNFKEFFDTVVVKMNFQHKTNILQALHTWIGEVSDGKG
jgi:hypothetical protein|tara:strand:+ start:305 stop:754 length:450 start_codon:yes stop_codon:yes gene_type:complete